MKRRVVYTLAFLLLAITAYAQRPSVTWRNFNLHPLPLTQLGWVATQPSSPQETWRWSVGCETLDRDFANFQNYKTYFHELGIGFARIQSGWARTEKQKGVYDFAWLDSIVDGLIEQGVRPWMCLCYGNPIYGSEIDLGAKMISGKETMKAWEDYVYATVKHYGGKVALWEVWNEPDLVKHANAASMYGNMLSTAMKGIKRADKKARIAAFGLAHAWNTAFVTTALDVVKKDGRINDLDMVTYHAYYPNPDDAAPHMALLDKTVKAYNPNIRLMMGESGCPSILEWGHAMNGVEWDEYAQAKWDLRRMCVDFKADIPTSVFTMVDLQYQSMLQSFGLVRMNLLKEPVYKRPAFYAVQHLANIITPDIMPDTTLKASSSSARYINHVGLSRRGKTIGAVVWFCDRRPGNSLQTEPVTLQLKGIDIKTPVLVEPITGKVYELKHNIYRGANYDGTLKIADLPMWDSPMIIIEKKELKMRSTPIMEAAGVPMNWRK